MRSDSKAQAREYKNLCLDVFFLPFRFQCTHIDNCIVEYEVFCRETDGGRSTGMMKDIPKISLNIRVICLYILQELRNQHGPNRDRDDQATKGVRWMPWH